MRKLTPILLLLTLVSLSSIAPVAAYVPQLPDEGKPLDMPIALPPGPSTWLLGQPYGNTTGAFNRGSMWYEAGQRLHFGLDIGMPCGTPLVAAADAVVMGVDDFGFGSGPHNLILRHEEYGLTTLYGHLLERPPLVNGQRVTRGQEVALSGDPDGPSCDSRPHLHFEVRSLDYLTAYNPVEYVNAAWHSLSSIGSFSSQSFQRDLNNPRRWLTLLDQPPVRFGGGALNAYSATWPPEQQPPTNPPLANDAGELAQFAPFVFRRLTYEGCCFWPFWHPSDGNRLYTIDGGENQRAGIYEWQLGANEQFNMIGLAPPPFLSPDGSHEIHPAVEGALIRRRSDGTEWIVNTGGNLPAFNTDNTRLMWIQRSGASVPGQPAPDVDIWISDANGGNAQLVTAQQGGSVVWLDAERLLITTSERQQTTLTVFNIIDSTSHPLGTWQRLRSISIAPGGGRVAFYVTYADDPTANGVYTVQTQPGAQAQKMSWFGAWRWRDADSLFYIPFDPSTNQQSLIHYHIPTGASRPIIDASTAFTIANGDWSVSPDGHRIVYLNAIDLTTWVIEEVNALQ